MSYLDLLRRAEAMVEGERSLISNLANLSALLWESLEDINWAGFYLATGNELLLGPFQGKPACIHIPFGKGVCGTAAAERRTLLVPDVHEFPGHIACDSASHSELVVPLLKSSGRVLGVLDLDSPLPSRFTKEDAEIMERLARLIASACDWSEKYL